MEESSNVRPEETLKGQAHDEQKEVVVEDSAEPKPAGVEFAGDIIADGNSMSVNEKPEGEDSSSSSSSADKDNEPEEKSPRVENSESFEEEKVVSDSVIESVEMEQGVSLTEEFNQDTEPPSVEKSGDSEVAKPDEKETEESILSSLDKTYAVSPKLVTGLKKETQQLSSAESDSALLTDVESKGIDKEKTVPGMDDTNGSTVAADVVSRGIEETTISCLDGNDGVPAASIAQGITETEIPASGNNPGGSSGFPELTSKEKVEDSLQEANVPIVKTRDAGAGELVNNPDIHESTGNQPTVSLSHHPMQPTSWKSCCGLFDVLRRSDR